MAVLNNTGIRAGASGAAAADPGYQIKKSLRFNDDDSARLTRTFQSGGNRKTFTFSCWLKRNAVGAINKGIFGKASDFFIRFSDDGGGDTIRVYENGSFSVVTEAQYIDTSAWMHLCVAVDTTYDLELDRVRIFVNGKRCLTSQSVTCTYPSLNADTSVNLAAEHSLGRVQTSAWYDGYMADVHFIDGKALYPSAFGKMSASGSWDPIEHKLTSPNDGTTWSTTGTWSGGESLSDNEGPDKLFNGDFSNYHAHTSAPGVWHWSGISIPVNTSLRLRADVTGSGMDILVNGGTDSGDSEIVVTPSASSDQQWIDIPIDGPFTLTKLSVERGSSGNYIDVRAIELDGVLMRDGITDNTDAVYGTTGFHLNFEDNSSNAAIGTDASPNTNTWTPSNLTAIDGKVTAANATGAKPILVPTDSYGKTTGGSVDTTDSAKAHLKLALPFQHDTNDVHHTVKGSGSARTVTTVNSAYTTNAQYYGGAGDFTDTTDRFSNEVSNSDGHFDVGTGNVTIEWWAYYPSTVSSNGYIFFANSTNGDDCYAYAHSNGMVAVKFAGFTWQAWPGSSGNHDDWENGKWNHFCIMRSGSTWTAYMNGVAKRTTTNAVDFNPGDTIGIGNYSNSSLSYHAKCYIQDFRWYNTDKYSGDFTVPDAAGLPDIIDVLCDTPTNGGTDSGAGGEVYGNYCTWNRYQNVKRAGTDGRTFRDGDLEVVTGTTTHGLTFGTFPINQGKWYWEVKVKLNNGNCTIGVADSEIYYADNYLYEGNKGKGYISNTGAAASNTLSTYTVGDVIGVAYDYDAGKIWYSKNGVWQNAGTTSTEAAGPDASNPSHSGIDTDTIMHPAVSATSVSNCTLLLNAGQKAFVGTPPSGYKCLCTKNLPDLGFIPREHHRNKTYKGIAGGKNLKGFGFAPDLLAVTNRTNTGYNWAVMNSVWGAQEFVCWNLASPRSAHANVPASFDSDGVTWGAANNGVNKSGSEHVAYGWKAAGSTTTVSASDSDYGSPDIGSSIRVNSDAKFSIVKFNSGATGGDLSVSHNLDAPPDWCMIKENTSGVDWLVFGKKLIYNNDNTYSKVNETVISLNKGTSWNAADNLYGSEDGWTNKLFDFNMGGNVNASKDFECYFWSEVKGYSKFGRYEGTGAVNFIPCGFRPRTIMLYNADIDHNSEGSTHWCIYDTSVSPYNRVEECQQPSHTSGGNETSSEIAIDIVSNGFILKTTGAFGDNDNNASNNHIYTFAAWAEEPFKTARAR